MRRHDRRRSGRPLTARGCGSRRSVRRLLARGAHGARRRLQGVERSTRRTFRASAASARATRPPRHLVGQTQSCRRVEIGIARRAATLPALCAPRAETRAGSAWRNAPANSHEPNRMRGVPANAAATAPDRHARWHRPLQAGWAKPAGPLRGATRLRGAWTVAARARPSSAPPCRRRAP
jgi:hypothetical protein